MQRERETRRPRDEDEDDDVVGTNKRRRKGQSQKNPPPSRTIQQAPPSQLGPTANRKIKDVVGTDWRSRLSEVGHQGQLNSCWVFSTLDSIETLHEIKFGKKIQLSKQQLIDYVWPKHKYNSGAGHSVSGTLDYIKKNGITTELVYKYLGYRQDKSDSEMTTQFKDLYFIKDYWRVTDPDGISGILKDGPLIIRFKFDRSFMAKKDWSIYIPEEESADHYHGALLVGEGMEIQTNGKPLNYWIIKNSWGTDWGKMGFGRIIKNHYSLEIEAWYPILWDDEFGWGMKR